MAEAPMTRRDDIRWNPPEALDPVEAKIMKRLKRTGRLFAFLRRHRHELLNEEFQAKLAVMYLDVGSGRPPVAPARLVMVTLLQAYTQVSDAEAVHFALFDKRWQMCLDCMDCEEAPFSQGLLAEFRFRLISHDLDRELIRRTVELAKETGDFGFKQLRVALDSAPIWGAGRVEDTYNLIGHGLLVCAACAADLWDLTTEEVIGDAGLKIVGRSSVKAALDIDWDDVVSRRDALDRLLEETTFFQGWLEKKARPPLDTLEAKHAARALDASLKQLERLISQDVEPDPDRKDGHRIIEGTTKDRQASVADPEMRHGRKSKSTTITGYKGHIVEELDHNLVLDAMAEPANKKEYEAADTMRAEVETYGEVRELHIDRGFLSAEWVQDLNARGVPVYSKPWNQTNKGLFPKSSFMIDLVAGTVTCPGGEVASVESARPGGDGRRQVPFKQCNACAMKSQCTTSSRGRTVVLHEHEEFLQRLLAAKRTPEGRARLRDRTAVEHGLAHVLVYAPHDARYFGARKNTFALRRAGAVTNLQVVDRLYALEVA
jgi:hypothetical protein